MIKAVLIDDEEIALDVLDILLGEAGGVSVVGKFNQASEALRQLGRIEPDLIFIDIEMPGMNGLAAAGQLLAKLPECEVIFVTAYEEYALKAFEVSAFDYLLKPVSKERLAKTLERYRLRRRKPSIDARPPAELLPSAIQTEEGHEPRLRLNVLGSMEVYDATGRLMTWRTKKTKEMFAYLWQYAGSPVNRFKIMDDLWPELPLDKAQSLLHTTLYQLRSTLKQAGFPDMIMFGDERYWMKVERIRSDAGQLNELKQQDADPHTIEQLLAMYRGDYLETESYSWSEHMRYRLRSSFIGCLEKWLPQANVAMKEAMLRQLVKLEPYGEAHYRQLLELLEERGDTSAASWLRERMNQRLTEELENGPS